MKRFFLFISVGTVLLTGIGCGDKTIKSELECSYTSNTVLKNKNDGVDYICNCPIEITEGTLTIEPGVTIEFTPNGSIEVLYGGAIKAVGTADKPIVFRGQNSAAGSWNGINIASENTTNELNYVTISDAGEHDFIINIGGFSHTNKTALLVKGKLKMNNSTVSNSSGYGIAYSEEASSLDFTNNKIMGCTGFPILMYAGDLSGTSLSTCTFSQNTKNYIGIYSSSSNKEVEHVVHFIETPIPYFALTSMGFLNTTTFAAGVEMVMSSNAGMSVKNNGSMAVNGTSLNPVTIRGEYPLAGYWKGILVNTNNPNNVFNYLNITDGGSEALGVFTNITNLALGDYEISFLTVNNCTSNNHNGNQASVNSGSTFNNNSPQITDVAQH